MLAVEYIELVSFIKQASLALAGAAALWGAVIYFLSVRAKKGGHNETGSLILEWISLRLFALFSAGAAVAVIAFSELYSISTAGAHEGIVIVPTKSEISSAVFLTLPLYAFFIAFVLVTVWMRVAKTALFRRFLPYIYVAGFVLSLVLISLPAWTGRLDPTQWFYIGHSVHSIFTVGTVLVLDFLILSSQSSNILKQHIFPLFPVLSGVIWVGLGFDFLSVWLVFEEALRFTPKFFFMQTVIGILIINGILLSGPITRAMTKAIKKKGIELSKRMTTFANIAGTISITSWLTITFIDYVESAELSYWGLMMGYLLFGMALYVGHELYEKFGEKPPEFLSVNNRI
ncbi:MAG: hypothetical protein U5L75_01700 [Candidatus Campbellbacteria bacterium]|nr:hypothetical protein [Candidatus Campbellbacteria bacterium]